MHKLIRRIALVLLALAIFVPAANANAVFYVSPSGDDSAPGSYDRPFATLERARDAVRKLKGTDGLPDGGITVHIRGGVYPLTKTFNLSDIDSGTESSPIVYQAYKNEQVRLIGGKQVNGFRPISDPVVLKRIDPKYHDKILQTDLRAQGITDFGQVSPQKFGGPAHSTGLELFFEDKPMTLARWPNEGFVKITGLYEPGTVNVRGTKGSKTGKFMYEGDRPKRWAEENDVWVHGYWFWDWSDERHQVESIDTEKRMISVKPPYHGTDIESGNGFMV